MISNANGTTISPPSASLGSSSTSRETASPSFPWPTRVLLRRGRPSLTPYKTAAGDGAGDRRAVRIQSAPIDIHGRLQEAALRELERSVFKCVTAPTEAEFRLTFMYSRGWIQGVITVDVDLIMLDGDWTSASNAMEMLTRSSGANVEGMPGPASWRVRSAALARGDEPRHRSTCGGRMSPARLHCSLRLRRDPVRGECPSRRTRACLRWCVCQPEPVRLHGRVLDV